MDLVFPALQTIALTGLLIGLIWIVWERANNPVDDARPATELEWRFVPPDPRDTLIVVTPPAEPDVAEVPGEEFPPPVIPDTVVAREPTRTDRGVVTGLH